MLVIKRDDYKEILGSMNLSIESKEKSVDIYHKNNWDRFTMHWDEGNKNDCPSYIDFFFDSKSMVDFLIQFIQKEKFKKCYISPIYNDTYKLKSFDDDVCKDIYDEFKKLINSLGLKVNTNCAIQMDKEEFINWCDRFSIGGFCGVSEYSVIIPELNILIFPYHHMNYLIYTNNKESLLLKLKSINMEELLFDY